MSAKKVKKATEKLITKSTKEFDIAKSRGVELKELLQYDHLGGNTLFEGDELKKHNKAEILQELEKSLEKNDYSNSIGPNATIIVDFMSAIRKVPLSKFSCIKDALECLWNMITKVGEANQIDIVFDSYVENSIKELTRESRSNDVEPVEYVNILLESPPPVEVDRFWASSKNKEELQILSREFFQEKAQEKNRTIVLSGYVTDGEGMQDCVMLKDGAITVMDNLKSSIEEADTRLIQHLIEAVKCKSEKVIVMSNDTDVVVYCLTYENRCQFYGCKELWVRFGAGEKTRNIPIHVLADKLGDHLSSSIILKTHVLTGCDVTSKIGTKSSAMKVNPERFLQAFGVGEPSDIAFKNAERYLVYVIQPSSSCMTFDELRYEMYRTQNKGLSELPPTSYSLHGHLLRCHYFVNFCLSLEQSDIHQNNLIPSPLNFGWKRVNGILLPQKYLRNMPSHYVNRCSCKKGCTKICGCKPEQCTEYCKCQDCCNM